MKIFGGGGGFSKGFHCFPRLPDQRRQRGAERPGRAAGQRDDMAGMMRQRAAAGTWRQLQAREVDPEAPELGAGKGAGARGHMLGGEQPAVCVAGA